MAHQHAARWIILMKNLGGWTRSLSYPYAYFSKEDAEKALADAKVNGGAMAYRLRRK